MKNFIVDKLNLSNFFVVVVFAFLAFTTIITSILFDDMKRLEKTVLENEEKEQLKNLYERYKEPSIYFIQERDYAVDKYYGLINEIELLLDIKEFVSLDEFYETARSLIMQRDFYKAKIDFCSELIKVYENYKEKTLDD
ncbi:MAG: hypothetical protein ACRCZB_04920 [Bacteroidales bacterium]